jgi:hypothetical protein
LRKLLLNSKILSHQKTAGLYCLGKTVRTLFSLTAFVAFNFKLKPPCFSDQKAHIATFADVYSLDVELTEAL